MSYSLFVLFLHTAVLVWLNYKNAYEYWTEQRMALNTEVGKPQTFSLARMLKAFNLLQHTCTRVNEGIKSGCTEPKKFFLFICFFHFVNNLLGNTRI